MAIPNVPFKTQLGHDELRSRAQKLGQRHRTILFLIDGRRPLAEVLSLAQQAGAATQHFEDLLRLGLVELPPEPAPPPVQAALPVLADEAALTTVELIVPSDPEAEVTIAAPLTAELPDLPEPPREPAPVTLPVLDEAVPVHTPVAAPQRAAIEPDATAAAPDIQLPLPDATEAEFLQQVRDLLTETLSIDAPLFSARTFIRVRGAQSVGELIDLVWEIQDHLSSKRHSGRELKSLQRARELLGLGNTLVSDDETRPPYLDE
jgi:hypothetical protein